MTQDEALKLALERLEKISDKSEECISTTLALVGPIALLQGVIAEREKAKQPSTVVPTIAIATAMIMMALGVMWAGFYAYYMTKDTWMELPVVITACFLFAVYCTLALASADIAKHFSKGNT